MQPSSDIAPEESHSNEWQELRGHARHQTVEVLRLILILLQDAVILVAGFLAEFAYEHWLHSSEPFFQLAIRLSSALFLLLYGITVTVHVVGYVRGQLGGTKATLLGQYRISKPRWPSRKQKSRSSYPLWKSVSNPSSASKASRRTSRQAAVAAARFLARLTAGCSPSKPA